MLAYAGIPSTFLFLPHPKAGTVFNLKKNRQGCRLTVMSKLYHSLACRLIMISPKTKLARDFCFFVYFCHYSLKD